MIAADLLMIGNYVMRDGKILQVLANGMGVIATDGDGYFPEEEFEPVPITPDILAKCGFVSGKNKDDFYYTDNDGHSICIVWYDDTQKWVFNGQNYIGIIHLEYLHELQRLVLSLTGKHLVVNI